MPAASLCDLWIRCGNGGRHDDDVGVTDVLGVVSDGNADAHRGKAIRDLRALRIGAADAVAEIREQLGNSAHPDAADAHEVHAASAAQVDLGIWGLGDLGIGHRYPLSASVSTRSTICAAAFGRANVRIAWLIARRR